MVPSRGHGWVFDAYRVVIRTTRGAMTPYRKPLVGELLTPTILERRAAADEPSAVGEPNAG